MNCTFKYGKIIKIIIFAAMSLSGLSANAQKKDAAPPSVKAAFLKEYSAASYVRWVKEQDKYEASFTLDAHRMSATYSADGRKEETETTILVNQLPEKARKTATSKGQIKEAASIIKADGTMLYEAQVNGVDLLFDKNGTLIKESN